MPQMSPATAEPTMEYIRHGPISWGAGAARLKARHCKKRAMAQR